MDLFRIGAQIGFKPDEVLDLSLDVFRACIQGYADRIFDSQLLGIQQGYWAGYYTRGKKPTAPKTIISKMLTQKSHMDTKEKQQHADEVDVEGFLAMEARFQERFGNLHNK